MLLLGLGLLQPSYHREYRLWGGLLLAVGLFWRCWGVAAWYHGNPQQDSRRLLTREGPYRVCRNPRYFGNLWLGLGGCLWAGLPLLVPGFLFSWALVHVPVICFEEIHLRQRHGCDFERYCGQTPAFPLAPSWQWLDQLGGLRWDRAFLAEYSTIQGWVLAASLIGLWQARHTGLWSISLVMLMVGIGLRQLRTRMRRTSC